MQAARHASVVPVIVREPLDGIIGGMHPGIEEDEEVQARNGDDPEQKPAERPEMRQRIPGWPESGVQKAFDPVEPPVENTLHCHHALLCSDPARW